MGKPYFEQHKTIRVENSQGGFKRAWIEVIDGESIMLKFPASTTPAQIEAKAAQELQRLKDIEALRDQQAALSEQSAEIQQQIEALGG